MKANEANKGETKMKHHVKMWGIVDAGSPAGKKLITIGLDDNPNLYRTREAAELQAQRNGSKVVEVELSY